MENNSNSPSGNQSVGRSKMQKLSITKQQNNFLLQKINVMKEKFDEFEKQKTEVFYL